MADEKLQAQKSGDAPSVCSLDVDDIFVQLHIKAAKECGGNECIIQNSAIDGEKEGDYSFYGPGKHVIAALPSAKTKSSKVKKSVAFKAIQTYVQWFSGPDISKSITEADLQLIQSDEEPQAEKKLSGIEDKKPASTENSEQHESLHVPSFKEYLLLEDGEDTEASSDDSSEDSEKKDDAEEKNDEASDKDSEQDKDEDNKEQSDDEAAGYYITYKLDVEGEKSSTFKDVFEKFAKKLGNFVKKLGIGIGISAHSFKNGGKDFDMYGSATIGDVVNALDKIFGKLDPNELQKNFQAELKKKYPQTSTSTEIFDKGTIVKHLKDKLESADKAKINKANLSLCVKVHKDDKSKKLINTKVVAELVTHAIKGIFKTFKNAVDKKDVILVNGYSENDKTKNKNAVQLSPNKNDESVAAAEGNILLEADANKKPEDVLNEMQDYLQKEVDGKFSTAKKHEASIKEANEVIDYISKVSERDEKIFNTIKKHKYAFMIEIESEKQKEASTEAKESMHVLHASNDMLRMLFEAIDDSDPNKAAIEKIFSNLANNSKFLDARGKQASEEDEIFAFDIEAVKSESMSNTRSLYRMIFDDASAQKTFRTLIYEASNYGKDVGKEIIQKKGFKNLVANIDKMEAFIKANYKTEKGKKKEESTRHKALELFGKFKDCKSDEDMEKFIDDNFKDGGKDSSDNRLRTAFIKAMDVDGIPDKEESSDKIKITFKDIDDPSQLSDPSNISDDDKEKYKQIDDPIEVEPGEDVKIPDVKDKDGFKFDHFDPDPKSMKEDGDTFAIYKKDEADDNNGSCKIKLFDADPKSGEKTGDPIAEFDVPKGQPFNSTDDGKKAFEDANKQLEDNKKDGFAFKGWSKDASDKAEEDTELIAKYLADDDKDKEFTVIFQYPPDPSKEDEIEEVPGELGTQKIKAGESAKEPDPPEIEGWKFKKWSDDTNNVTDDMMVLAEYQKPARFIFKAPEDPEKPEDTKPIGDPVEAEEGKSPEPPEPPKFDNYEFDKWDPDPKTVKDPEGDQDIVAIYKKKDDNGDGDSKSTSHTLYVLPDYAGILDDDGTVKITFKAPALDEEDPNKTDIEQLQRLGDPVEVAKGTPLVFDKGAGKFKQGDNEISVPQLPDLSKAGYEFDKWDPDPSKGFTEDTEISAIYKENSSKKPSELKKGGDYDFYIVPMKGLKWKEDDNEGSK